MLLRLPRLLLALALAYSIGLHWAVLQTAAWVGMVISYSQTTSLEEALVKTFDGRHPCCLCKHICEGKKSEKKSDRKLDLKKFEFTDLRQSFICSTPYQIQSFHPLDDVVRLLAVTPPVPPPRSV